MNDRRVIQPEALETLRKIVIDLFASKQFHRVGIREICKMAGVSPQTVYKYFGNKQELLLGCVEQDLEHLTKAIKEKISNSTASREQLELLAGVQFEFYSKRPTIARIVFLNLPPIYWVEQKSKAQTEYKEILRSILEELAVEEPNLQIENTSIIQDVIMGGFGRVIIRWLMTDSESDLNVLAQQFRQVVRPILG